MNRPIFHLFQIIISGFVGLILALGALPAVAQTPSQAQQSAIRSACPSDYRAHCASVPPGGKPALACLQKNVASLSDACRTAVQAVGSSATAPAATTPPASSGTAKTTGVAPTTKAPTAAATPPPAVRLPPRQEAALIRRSCNADFRRYCRGVPLGGGNVVSCLKANAASLSPRCQSALAPLAR